MEFVNLYGCTTAEKLIKLTEAVNDLHSIVNELGLFVYDGAYNNDDPNFQYNAELLHTPTVTTEVLNRPVYFSENTMIAVITTYGNNLFTVRNAHNITGAQGAQGERGEQGEKGERGEQGIQGEKGDTGAQGARGLTGTGVANITNGNPYVSGEYTVTPVDYEMSDGTEIPLSVYAKNGADGGVTVDDALSTESVNPVQNKVVTAAINAAASTPKLYRHNMSMNLVVGSSQYNGIRWSITDTTESQYTSDDFFRKYGYIHGIIPAFYAGQIVTPGAGERIAVTGIEASTPNNIKVYGILVSNASGQYSNPRTVSFSAPLNNDAFEDDVSEV